MRRALLFSFLIIFILAVASSVLFLSQFDAILSGFDWDQKDGQVLVRTNDIAANAKEFLISGDEAVLDKAALQNGCSVLLVGLDGIVLYDSDGKVSGRLDVNGLLSSVDATKSVRMIGSGKDGKYTLAVISTGETPPRLEPVRSAAFVMTGAFFLLFVVLAAVLYLILDRQVLRPFRKLERAVHDIAKGNFDSPILIGRRNPFGAFTWAFDLLRSEMKSSRAREEAAALTKKQLVASLSHDLRTPVASIRAYTESLQSLKDKNSERAERYIGVILQKTDEVAHLSQDMFQHALMDLERLQLDPHPYPARELLNGIFEQMMLQYDNRIVILSAIPEVRIVTDKQRLEQVFGNVMTNSAKYAPRSQIEVDCSVQDGFLRCTIRDFGPGVDPQDLSFLFDQFYRGRNARECGAPGAGLGLYTSRMILDKTSGDIRAGNWLQGDESGFLVEVFLKIVEE